MEHVRCETGLLKVAVRGEPSVRARRLDNHEREAIRQAPLLAGAAPVQSDRCIAEVGLKRYDRDSPVRDI